LALVPPSPPLPPIDSATMDGREAPNHTWKKSRPWRGRARWRLSWVQCWIRRNHVRPITVR
jgi:hypothetical protein